MDNSQNLVRLGKLLQEHRKNKKLTLEAISRQLKIGTQILKSIEKAEIDKLPHYVYLRGFILSYAKEVGLDQKEVLKEIKGLAPDSEDTSLSQLNPPEEEELIGTQSKFVSIISAMVILFSLVAILVITNFIRSHKSNENNVNQIVDEGPVIDQEEDHTEPSLSPSPEKTEPSIKAPEEPESNEPKESVIKSPPIPSSDDSNIAELQLEIVVKAIEDVSFSYQLDTQNREEIFLKKDQFRVLKGIRSIRIHTDNSDRIQILQDGRTFGVFGSGGAKEQTFYSQSL